MLIRFIAVIISQYIQILTHVVHLKLICYVNYNPNKKSISLSIQIQIYVYICNILLCTHIRLVLFLWRMLKNTGSHILYFQIPHERRQAIPPYSIVFHLPVSPALVFHVNFRISWLEKNRYYCVCACKHRQFIYREFFKCKGSSLYLNSHSFMYI